MKKQYKEEMEEFYSEHPDARPSLKVKTNSRKETTSQDKKQTSKIAQAVDDSIDSTEQRINEVCETCLLKIPLYYLLNSWPTNGLDVLGTQWIYPFR